MEIEYLLVVTSASPGEDDPSIEYSAEAMFAEERLRPLSLRIGFVAGCLERATQGDEIRAAHRVGERVVELIFVDRLGIGL